MTGRHTSVSERTECSCAARPGADPRLDSSRSPRRRSVAREEGEEVGVVDGLHRRELRLLPPAGRPAVEGRHNALHVLVQRARPP